MYQKGECVMYRERCYVVSDVEEKGGRQMVTIENSSGSMYTKCSTELKRPEPIQDILKKRVGKLIKIPTFDEIVQNIREDILNHDYSIEQILTTVDIPKDYQIPNDLVKDITKELKIEHPYVVSVRKSIDGDKIYVEIKPGLEE